jgi:hypothetical protein
MKLGDSQRRLLARMAIGVLLIERAAGKLCKNFSA